MNTKSQNSNKCAVALVLVLGFLVIISALAVAFFASVTTELRASRNFQSNVNTHQLQDSVVNLVEGQIRQATIVTANRITQNVAWASQPGMLRTYGDGQGGASSSPLTFYKLYSSNAMTLTGFKPGAAPAPDYSITWDKLPALWTDLNAPVLVQDPNFPNDPTHLLPRFPIIDPQANDQGSPDTNVVEGFNYTDNGMDQLRISSSGGTDARLPMPVRWIYILKDGTLTTPADATATTVVTTVSFATSANQPSLANPIVGRVAFWTDDDTCKLNVNVAAGSPPAPVVGIPTILPPNGYTADRYLGSYWDTPRVTSMIDEGQVYGPGVSGYVTGASGNGGKPLPNSGGMASVQMLQNEFQRYPGHPATTSLANIFRNMLSAEQLYQISPRIANGTTTSEGGTNRLHIEPTAPVAGAATTGAAPNAPLAIRYDRLYDSVDEMIFTYQGNSGTNGVRRTNINSVSPALTPTTYTPGNAIQPTGFTPGLLDRLRFFVTAYNRAPDLNLFGHPRICVWPVRSQTYSDDVSPAKSGLNAYDSLSLFCSTIGPAVVLYPGFNSDAANASNPPFRYSFFRRELTGTTVSSTGTDILLGRNQQLLAYLQDTTKKPIPGFGNSFNGGKYTTADMDETLIEMFDYIRCANLYDTTITVAPTTTNPHPFSSTGIVMPSVGNLDSGAQLGMGRFPTISEASLVFYFAGSNTMANGVAAGANPALSPAAPNTLYKPATILAPGATTAQFSEASGVMVITPPDIPFATVSSSGQAKPSQVPTTRYMRAALLLSTFNPMQGYGPVQSPTSTQPMVSFQVSGMKNALTIQGGSVPLSSDSATNVFNVDTGTISLGVVSGNFWGGRNFGGFEGFEHTLYNATFSGTNLVQNPYPLMTGAANFRMGLAIGALATPATPPAANTAADYEEVAPPTFRLVNGGPITVKVLYGGASLQTIALNFPSAVLPAPRGDDIVDAEPFRIQTAATLTPVLVTGKPVLASTLVPQDNAPHTVTVGSITFPSNTVGGPGSYGQLRRWYWSSSFASFDPNATRTVPAKISGSAIPTAFTTDRTLATARDFQLRINYVLANGANSDNPITAGQANPSQITGWHGERWRQILQPGDTVRSLIFCDATQISGTTVGTKTGDLRLAAVTNNIVVPTTGSGMPGFYPHPDYSTTNMQQACLLRMADGNLYYNYTNHDFELFFANSSVASATTGLGPAVGKEGRSWYSTLNPFGNHVALGAPSVSNSLTNDQFPQGFAMGQLPRKLSAGSTKVWVNGVQRFDGQPGDFDTGVGAYPDGPFFNKQDEGNAIFVYIDSFTGQLAYPIPYYGDGSYAAPGSAFNSPNRQMPSPGMIGSLLSKASPQSGHPWETLCFCPNPAGPNHNGIAVSPKDELLLDLFQMPIVQPYPISEPFSTAGRVNLNYQIYPFDYIERSSALRAVLASERVSVIGTSAQATLTPSNTSGPMYSLYKQQSANVMTNNIRNTIDRQLTMGMISNWITLNGLFRSPAQICEVYLVPTGWFPTGSPAPTPNAVQQLWTVNGDLTGDNMREKPYVDMYPRLTTKSNTYTIHMRVQALKQQPHTNSNDYLTWDESKDSVLGEYRGSATIERYIDPADRHFNPKDSLTIQSGDFVNPDQIDDPSVSLESLYRFRTVNTKKFSP